MKKEITTYKLIGRPFGKWAIQYSQDTGLLRDGFAFYKCSCGKPHRVRYNDETRRWEISIKSNHASKNPNLYSARGHNHTPNF